MQEQIFFKKKLMTIIMADNSPEAKPTIKPLSKSKIEKIVSNSELNKGKVLASNTKNTSIPERDLSYASVGNTNKKSEPSDKAKKNSFHAYSSV